MRDTGEEERKESEKIKKDRRTVIPEEELNSDPNQMEREERVNLSRLNSTF